MKILLFVLSLIVAFPLWGQIPSGSFLIDGSFNLNLTSKPNTFHNYRNEAGENALVPQRSTSFNGTSSIGIPFQFSERLIFGAGFSLGLYKNRVWTKEDIILGINTLTNFDNTIRRRTLAPFVYTRYFMSIKGDFYFAPRLQLRQSWQTEITSENIFTDGEPIDIRDIEIREWRQQVVLNPALVWMVNNHFGIQAYFGNISLTHTNYPDEDKSSLTTFRASFSTTSFQLGVFGLFGKREKETEKID